MKIFLLAILLVTSFSLHTLRLQMSTLGYKSNSQMNYQGNILNNNITKNNEMNENNQAKHK